jgi:Na+-translocating ferredoxin:NAD+ oxidoreductase RNF subunit RnfB
MDISLIIKAALSIGGLGLIFGVGLSIAAKKFAIEVDPLIPQVREYLPGANCGGCGFAGCDAFAKAVVAGEAKPNGCPVNSEENAAKVAAVLGMEPSQSEREIAFVKCFGKKENATDKYEYYGITDCQNATYLQGAGPKSCEYGCLGYGSCVNACMFDAIKIVDGIAVVNRDNCTGCGMCVTACPKNIIELIKESAATKVRCMSHDKGKITKTNCSVGCIGCMMCVKACEHDAIHVENFLATIDYDKCVNCGACVAKCPTHAIVQE